MKQRILLWDNDGTISGSQDPNDKTSHAKIILPGVKDAMSLAPFNFVISGYKSPESEAQNFDPEKVTERFITLMNQLPISAAAFSPTIGGVACYVVVKKDDTIVVKKAHEDSRYQSYIGEFKKPGIGMFTVMRDIALEAFGQRIDEQNAVMIGDTWHDEKAAQEFGIPFIDAHNIHNGSFLYKENQLYK